MKTLLRLAFSFSLLILQAGVSQGAILYAAVNNAVPLNGATNSNLVTIDPTTGAVLSTIGATGFVVSDLAVDPTTGVLYASTARAALSNPSSLIRIDTATGAGTLIGSFEVGRSMAGLAFDAAGTLYGWGSRRGDVFTFDSNLHTVDLVTGAATQVGDWSAIDEETRGNGLAFDVSGTLFWSGRTWLTNALNTVNPATGLVTGSLALSGLVFGLSPLASLSFDDDGTLFGLEDFGNFFPPDLISIDTLTGAITVIDVLPLGVNGFAFSICDTLLCLDPVLALNAPGTQHTVIATVVDAERDPVVGELVSFDVEEGPNAGDSGSQTTDAEGRADFTYLGDGGKGVDLIKATTALDSSQARKFWDLDCNLNNVADTCDLDCGGFGGQCDIFNCGTSDDSDADGIPDECVGAVEIDVKPGPASVINVSTADKIEVAILGADDFEVQDIDVSTLKFGPAAVSPFLWAGTTVEDIDLDGIDDRVVFFRQEESGIQVGDTEACLTGELMSGLPFSGCDDTITVVACGLGFELVLILPPLAWLRARRRRA